MLDLILKLGVGVMGLYFIFFSLKIYSKEEIVMHDKVYKGEKAKKLSRDYLFVGCSLFFGIIIIHLLS